MASHLSMMHTREVQPLRVKDSIRKFGYLAAVSAPWLALLAFLAYDARRFLLDDAFISFRYARNLLEGNGLVWNPGERVEGYSNFLWVLELAAIWAATGVPPEDFVWWLSATFTVATLAAMAWWAWKLPGVRSRALVWWMTLGFLCASATFAKWTSGGGLETRQFTFFVVLAVVALTAHRGSRRGLLVASFSLALASLTRPEGPLIAACCFAWWAAQGLADGERGDGGERSGGIREWAFELLRRIDWRGALALALPFLLIVGAHFLWRYSYYDEWLPNTYFAKYVRPWWDIGLQYLAAAGVETGLYLLLPLSAGAAWMLWRERRDLAYGLPLLIITLYAVYLARSGGHNHGWRMLDFYWPLLALPAADGLARVGASAAGAWDLLRLSRRARKSGGGVLHALDSGKRSRNGRLRAVALFLPVLFYAGAIQGALFWDAFYRWDALPRIAENRLSAQRRPEWVPPAPGMPALVALSANLRDSINARGSGRLSGPYFVNRLRRTWEVYENMERGFIPSDATSLVEAAGVKPYHLPGLTFVDYLGLNDWVIARNPVTVPNSERILAHDRLPPPGYLEERGVNFDVHAPARSAIAALSTAPYAAQFAPGLWMPFDAPSLEWVGERFDSFVTLDGFATPIIERDGALLVSSRFDIYDAPASDSPLSEGRRLLVYVREPCDREDIRDEIFLRIRPLDENDLPEGRAERHTFAFADWGSRRDGRCIAVYPLPDYPIASIRTGQFNVWESVAQFIVTDDSVALLESARLLASSQFDIYEVPASDSPASGGRRALAYVREPCAEEDVSAKFFLHLNPVDENDLPADRREFGFDNLDFDFAYVGLRQSERCVALRYLPDYPIASVATGQFTEQGTVWSAEFALPDDQ